MSIISNKNESVIDLKKENGKEENKFVGMVQHYIQQQMLRFEDKDTLLLTSLSQNSSVVMRTKIDLTAPSLSNSNSQRVVVVGQKRTSNASLKLVSI